MDENKKMIPESTENTPLSDDQLADVSGGETVIILTHPINAKRCAADPSHVYPAYADACPKCGSKEFTWYVV